MQELKIFESEEFGNIRTLTDEKNSSLFCGIDVAKALGYSNPRKAIRDHTKGGVKRSMVTFTTNQYGKTSTQTVETTFITEGDVYRLIIRSRLPSAEKFERLIFEEILPSIYQTGGYLTDEKIMEILKTPEGIYQLLNSLKKRFRKSLNPALFEITIGINQQD